MDSEPLIEDDEELEEALEEFEEYFGDAIYCRSCGNFVRIQDILEDEICPFCMDELSMKLEEKGYIYDEELGKYIKESEEQMEGKCED